ncbi:hypothetical protein B296_00043214 [Ensete ventricosum]|uniref:Uncharacterized protein n=1 Tax=Ensete ventricosum TaxID=4639 RepID=A0A426WZK3_ENSVE|nr:hypothetical protein B296_00043214 [Ensete ventricosum]
MEQALLVQARVRWLARGLLGTELKLGRMSGDPELGLGGRLLEWWSLGAFIVSIVDHSYKVTLLLLWSTTSSYPSTTLAVLALNISVDANTAPSVSVPSAPPPSTSDSGGREGAPHGMASAVGVPAMRIRLAARRQRKHENTAPHHLATISFIPAVVGSCEMMGSQ